MTREQAMREARRRWGGKALIRAAAALSSPEQREAARATMAEANAELTRLKAERKARLDALDWLNDLNQQIAATQQRASVATSDAHYYKFAVGYDAHGFAFHVNGQGDTWEQAFSAADKK